MSKLNNLPENESRRINLPRPLEIALMTLYSPIAGAQAIALGLCVSAVHSRPVRYINGREDTNGFSKESALTRFVQGAELVLTAYGYLGKTAQST